MRPLTEVDALRADHVAHLQRQREAGRFLAWGRLVPPTGGFVIARGMDRTALDAVLSEDPFTIGGVAEWDVHELSLTGGAPELRSLLSPGHPG